MISDIVVIQIKPCPEIKIPDPAFSAILYTTLDSYSNNPVQFMQVNNESSLIS
jgi:hypothetical protein